MSAIDTQPAELLTAWNAAYRAARRSPVLSALRLAAADVDALARQIADRCVAKARHARAAGRPPTRRAS